MSELEITDEMAIAIRNKFGAKYIFTGREEVKKLVEIALEELASRFNTDFSLYNQAIDLADSKDSVDHQIAVKRVAKYAAWVEYNYMINNDQLEYLQAIYNKMSIDMSELKNKLKMLEKTA